MKEVGEDEEEVEPEKTDSVIIRKKEDTNNNKKAEEQPKKKEGDKKETKKEASTIKESPAVKTKKTDTIIKDNNNNTHTATTTKKSRVQSSRHVRALGRSNSESKAHSSEIVGKPKAPPQRGRLKSVDVGEVSRRNRKKLSKIAPPPPISKKVKSGGGGGDHDESDESSDSDLDSLIYGPAGGEDAEGMPEILRLLKIDRKDNQRLVRNLETLFGLTGSGNKIPTTMAGSVTLTVPTPPQTQQPHQEETQATPKLNLSSMVAAPSLLFTDISPENMALQLTLIDHELYKSIRASELLQKNFTEREKSPFFSIMADRFNLVKLSQYFNYNYSKKNNLS